MILRKDLRYVVLDFETTGTDRKYDEIIQVGIVEMNADGHLVQEFSSFVKPKHAEKLHDMINMITGIDWSQLEDAPDWSEIHEKVASFFDDKTVIIGHSVGFDLAFLRRYGVMGGYAHIDTLPLCQALVPYANSYALEVIAQQILGDRAIPKEGFHDASVDCEVTGKIFFNLVGKLESLMYIYPYLREISKRVESGLALCLTYNPDARYLLKDIPVLSSRTPTEKHSKQAITIDPGNRYIGHNYLDDMLALTVQNSNVSVFASHPKALLAQKKLAKAGTLLALHDQIIFDNDVLRSFFMQKNWKEWEWHCATKYLLHANEKHKSYHCTQRYDYLFVKAMRNTSLRDSQKKLYTHEDLFTNVANLTLSASQHIMLYDKERLFDSRKKWRYSPVDFYTVADILEAIIYKYNLMDKPYEKIHNLVSTRYIFVGIFTHEAMTLLRDTGNEKVRVDAIFDSLYFGHSKHIWKSVVAAVKDLHLHVEPNDLPVFEKAFQKIAELLQFPCHLIHKRGNHQDRIQLQSVDNFVSRDDIKQFFSGYTVSFLSCLDPSLPSFQIPDSAIVPKPIMKWKDIKVSDKPKLCIIAPSKPAAQQLILSLHASKAYTDCFLAAEHVTGGAGKIIQQTLKKDSYILIGGYGFCMQCIAHGIVFDSLCALDIVSNGSINPFMDISYYAASKKK